MAMFRRLLAHGSLLLWLRQSAFSYPIKRQLIRSYLTLRHTNAFLTGYLNAGPPKCKVDHGRPCGCLSCGKQPIYGHASTNLQSADPNEFYNPYFCVEFEKAAGRVC